ncbi:MAG: hypothetical protein ACK47B_25160 [Armatimonadota bacterium]
MPVFSQVSRFDLQEPLSRLIIGGSVQLQWSADTPAVTDSTDCAAVTWFYTPRPEDPRSLKRITTQFREDFSRGLGIEWDRIPPFGFDWNADFEEAENRYFLRSSQKDAGPVVSQVELDQNSVLSVMVRPTTVSPQFAIGMRVQPNLNGYFIRQDGNSAKLMSGGRVLKEIRLTDIRRKRWYYYELGLRSWKRKDVEIRARILDEERRVLACFPPVWERPQDGKLLGPGAIALYPKADFAEVYVDPWDSRWISSNPNKANKFRWSTSNVADGEYHVVAEITETRRPPRMVVSPFKLEIRNLGRAAKD